MTDKILIPKPENFSFRHTVYSHGWYDLKPFELDTEKWRLRGVFPAGKRGKSVSAVISDSRKALVIEPADTVADPGKLIVSVKHLLRLDEDLSPFYETLSSEERLGWVAKMNAGRLLRSPTVFEDLVKTICTTNCSWGLTRIMVTNLVEKLGEATKCGRMAFPTPAAMASVTSDFYREEIRAGYRSPYFVELSEKIAGGMLDPERWVNSDLPTTELKKEMKAVKGVGDYAAETMLKLVGRYDGLALDSWVRSQFYKLHNNGKKCSDKRIHKFYRKFGDWKGLAAWCDVTENWFE